MNEFSQHFRLCLDEIYRYNRESNGRSESETGIRKSEFPASISSDNTEFMMSYKKIQKRWKIVGIEIKKTTATCNIAQ